MGPDIRLISSGRSDSADQFPPDQFRRAQPYQNPPTISRTITAARARNVTRGVCPASGGAKLGTTAAGLIREHTAGT